MKLKLTFKETYRFSNYVSKSYSVGYNGPNTGKII